ncbi:uncharacterized protein LOC113371245 [Ctenocephalides felis]|uniref:uncharacterized protein LOC113371245 n=1 Tax=Ctenocephalides felis TaxID=7515 RepID=UPI000E6E3BD4|nr:uncharacterized protein LOC113371245 [Ctenocephalides felis]
MLGLLHPNGEFVNIYHGKINNITVDCDNLDEAVHTYNTQQKRHIDTKALPESPKENSIADESYTVNKNHKKLVPPASLGNRNTNDNEKNKCFNSIRENDKMYNICNTDPIKTKSYNTCAKFTIDNNSFRTPRTLKCGQKIIISRSKLTPLPKVTVNNDPSLFLKQFKNDLPIDDNVSVTSSSLDVNELDEFLINDNGTFEKYMEISEKAEVTKNDKNRSLVAENFFKCWKFCDVLDNKGYALIHKAILNNNLYLLKLQCLALLSKKVPVGLRNKENRSTLEIAILNSSNIDIVRTLLCFGVSIAEANPDSGDNILHLAALYTKNIGVFKLLVERSDKKALCNYNNSGFTPLHLVVRTNNFKTEKVKVLLSNRYIREFINICDLTSGKTALFHAMENNDAKTIRELLSKGANPNIATLSGITLSDNYHELDISSELKEEFRQYLKSKETRIGKRVRNENIHSSSKKMNLEKLS